MATNFPTSVDNFTNPTANDSLNLPSHSTQHANANDAIEAVEDYLLNGAGKAGLVLLKTQTIGTAVSSVTVTDAFNASYDSYKILVTGGVASANNEFRFNFTGNTAGYYGAILYAGYGSTTAAAIAGSNLGYWTVGWGSTSGLSANFEVLNPYLNAQATYSQAGGVNNTSGSTIASNGFHNSTSSFTGFTLTSNTGTWTGGTIRVYGYRNA